MKISELVDMLQIMREEQGDLDVETLVGGTRCTLKEPKLAFRCLLKPNETRHRFWSNYDPVTRKGDPVCRID
jgi:hypothetical protein